MRKNQERERWLQDIEARQKNIVFPDTVQNEGRLWRNLGNPPFSIVSRIGLWILGIFVFGNVAFYVVILRRDNAWKQELAWTLLLLILIFGPIFGVLIWATRRNLKDVKKRSRKHPSAQS